MTATFIIELGPIAEDHGASLDVTGEMPLPTITVGTETYEPVGPADIDVVVINTGTAFEVAGRATAAVRAQCARCLRDFDLALGADVDAYFVDPAHAHEVPEEQDFALVEGDRIDLGPFVESALVVSIPLAPLHDPDCQGICPECGVDRNEEECDCAQVAPADSPFSALGGLLEEMKDDDESSGPDA
jgi:uncharacterized protein